jgi:NOL1/NOP2/fmu family ribosome biogenesis protein
MRIETYDKKEKEKFDHLLNEKYGLELKGQIIKQGNEKIRIFTGNLNERELNIISGTVRVETVGLYLATIDNEKNIRFSFDASYLGKEAKKNILELDDLQVRQWFQGNDILIDSQRSSDSSKNQTPTSKQSIAPNNTLTSTPNNTLTSNPFVFLRYKNEMVGCGKLTSEKKILNFVPKERRIKY